MTYREKIKKLNSFGKFINGKYQDEIILVLNKKYKDDKWSLVCAVMHWFNVVKSYLDYHKVIKTNTVDFNWGNVYLYLSSVDIITKGINDLYKMIKNDNKHIFDCENNIFYQPLLDDNHYFQNIRAIFGAHPTDLNGNGEFFVATFPTPYNNIFDQIKSISNKWDYYTLLWSKKKSDVFLQQEFGFNFHDIDRYLDKYISYLDIFYIEMKKMINDYYLKITHKKINRIKDLNKQIDLLVIEDKKRFNGKYNYDLITYKTLVNINIVDEKNKKEYQKYREKLLFLLPKIIKVIQNPVRYKSLSFLNKILDCRIPMFDKNTSYYYSKLLEYKNNGDMEKILINYFSKNMQLFNSNIANIEELYCLVMAYSYYISE